MSLIFIIEFIIVTRNKTNQFSQPILTLSLSIFPQTITANTTTYNRIINNKGSFTYSNPITYLINKYKN